MAPAARQTDLVQAGVRGRDGGVELANVAVYVRVGDPVGREFSTVWRDFVCRSRSQHLNELIYVLHVTHM